MTKTFDPTKPVQTRDGRKARILCTDRRGLYPIIALIEESQVGGDEMLYGYHATGSIHTPHKCEPDSRDLINIPQKREGFVNIYPREIFETIAGTSPVYPSKEAADHGASPHRIACVRIEWEE